MEDPIIPLQLWWGYSTQHRWVVLDRTLDPNRPSWPDDLCFFRCSDLSIYKEKRDNWKPPSYLFAERYLASLDTASSAQARGELITLQARAAEFHDEIYRQYAKTEQHKLNEAIRLEVAQEQEWLEQRKNEAIARHREFFEASGASYPGVLPASSQKTHRITHCYRCKRHLDNTIETECRQCHWIICECGACGCGWQTSPVTNG